jgi:23S rRNA pseudouridine955/2504/2580 synthase
MLLNKRPGVSVHEDEDGSTNTLITHIQAYLYQKGEYRPEDEQSFAPALCNRIDRNTGGIVIAAKNAEALRVMNEKIKKREIDKFYLAAVHGTPKPEAATIRGYLLKDDKKNIVRVYEKNPPRGAKEIITKYKVVAKAKDSSLIEVELLTGRTHQIRAHMAFVGNPLIGDGKYGINKDDRAKGYKYQALYSYRLRFSFDTSETTCLDYLNGKEFKIPKKDIYFTKDYF